jgi:hypothetical protein
VGNYRRYGRQLREYLENVCGMCLVAPAFLMWWEHFVATGDN